MWPIPVESAKVDYTTALLHSDSSDVSDVGAPLRMSTTYRYDSDPSKLVPIGENPKPDGKAVYSRLGQPNVDRVEQILEKVLGGYAIAYSSGLSAYHAALTHFNPNRVFISHGYHGCHGVLGLYQRRGVEIYDLEEVEMKARQGDLIHVETPLNPTGEARDLKYYSGISKARGCTLLVDSTFAPPPLQDPWIFGADIIMHSASKYFGGHSDVLAGVLATRDPAIRDSLLHDRVYLGTIIPTLEAWLLLRSLRTLEMRVMKQVDNTNRIVAYLKNNRAKFPALAAIHHATLQSEDFVREQQPYGGPPVFQLILTSPQKARVFPSKLQLFHHCTSLGGVESMIEWRCLSDDKVAHTVLRVSVGCENVEDLIADLSQGLSCI